ncbi:hypothetical protein Mal64_11570 [Pseudobythopirellula maris]|uniref:TIGR02453 family protein n=1 Tax=Pseudobythopirellula maris TaxID=2527991 RepID=A0A5C5ZU19_9BACT|nr:DUF2461 domain-containing protein [Pseudobythopirellula maris]TWT90760.1 hypothetical protein Mal64_11570 [Pseudobythopirellula maris]
MPSAPKFAGFPLGTLRFLEELSKNNRRDWFEKNRERYESEVRGPALAYIAAMERPLARVSPQFLAVPKKVGGSLMRIHRDVRFSKDKSPYKTNVGIQFRHAAGKDVHAPGLYLHIAPDGCFLGSGVWRPESSALAAIRRAIDADPSAWRKARDNKRFRAAWDLQGESLKRAPKGYPIDHPMIEDLRRKDHIAGCKIEPDELMSPDIVKETTAKFVATKPYLAFLCDAIGVEF